MFGECHAHVIMDGVNYRRAVDIHKDGVRDEAVRAHLKAYQDVGVTFVRDGGDAAGVSRRAKTLAPEYGIDYRTPVFAIHKNGHYGGIVGRGFDDLKEYRQLVDEAAAQGADFIKIMTTGIMDFKNHGKITGAPLESGEVKEMVHIAHESGFAVMSHTNGDYGVRAALEAGVDSLEHGNYMGEETMDMLAESGTIWVPTLATVWNLPGCGRFDDSFLLKIMETERHNLRLAYKKKAKVALGSDAGAHMVPHGWGILDEYHIFLEILGGAAEVRQWLEDGEKLIDKKFRRT